MPDTDQHTARSCGTALCYIVFEITSNLFYFKVTLSLSLYFFRLNSRMYSGKETTLYARSFIRRFFAYHRAVNHPHTNIILSWLSIPFVLKCAAKEKLKIGLQINIYCPKRFWIGILNRQGTEIIQTSLTLDSGKFIKFIQTFRPLVSFSYNLVLVLWILNTILELLFFSGKIVTSLANSFSMQKFLFKKHFWTLDVYL